MTAVLSEVRFYVDESALGIGKTLTAARKDVIHVGHPLIPQCPYGIHDDEWMPIVAERGLVAIGRDKHIRTRPAERAAISAIGLRVFRIGGKKDQSTWEWLGRFVRYWNRMEQIVAARPSGPWFYLINQTGLSEVSLD
jgi:PIN like domain